MSAISTKHCNTCDTTKPCSEFGLRAASRDGLAAKCKECQKAYDKARLNDPKRVAARKAYQQTDAYRESKRAAQKRYRERYPHKRAAHIAVGNALRDGKLTRQPCEVCGNPKSEAHHDDYGKPLGVKWLCDTHHKARHIELREQGIEP